MVKANGGNREILRILPLQTSLAESVRTLWKAVSHKNTKCLLKYVCV